MGKRVTEPEVPSKHQRQSVTFHGLNVGQHLGLSTYNNTAADANAVVWWMRCCCMHFPPNRVAVGILYLLVLSLASTY